MDALASHSVLAVSTAVGIAALVIAGAVGYAISEMQRSRLSASGGLPALVPVLVTVVVVGAGVYGLVELGKNDEWADTDSALAGAGWTLFGLTVALYASGGRRRIAIAPFAVSDASAPAVTIKQGSPVPLGVERLPELQGKSVERPIATETIVWWEGGAERQEIQAGTELDDNQAAQALAIERRNIAKEDVTYRDPARVRHKDPGEPVDDSLAALPEFQGKTEGTGADRRATVRVEYRDPAETKPLAAGAEVPAALLALPELTSKYEQRPFALRPFVYFAGAEKRKIEAGAAVPTDKERAMLAAQGRTTAVAVATEDVTFNARRFAVNDPVPEDVSDPAVTTSIGLRRGLRLRRLVVGEDGRWSTSKLQVVLWTYVVVFILLTLLYFTELLDQALNVRAGTDVDDVKGVQFSELDLPDAYYILLGGPFAAAILAKAFTQSKAESGTLAKTEDAGAPGPVQGLGQIISDDKGRTDILDLQYFAFNLIALGYVVIAFIWAVTSGFPEVPETLFGLTSAAALAYTSKKIADRAVPSITSVSPGRIRSGDVLEIRGQNLVLGAGKRPQVELDGRSVATVEIVNERAEPAAIGGGVADLLRVTVPVLSGNDTVKLVVIPEGGRPTAPTELQADRGAIAAVEPQPLRLGRDSRLLIRGNGLAETGAATRVLLGQTALNVEGSPQPDLVVATFGTGELQRIEAGSSVRLTVLVDGISFSRLIQIEKPEIAAVTPTPIERDVAKLLEITGTALDGRPGEVKLDGRELDPVSQDDTKIVARLRAADLAQYASDSELVVTVGGYEVRKQVAVKS